MKRLTKLLLITFLFISLKTQATHIIGGEISWKCTGAGDYIFYATTYRDCSGASANYQSIALDITGNPLPRNINGIVINQIILNPDSSKWLNSNNGTLGTVRCDSSSSTLSCLNGDKGAIQSFFYKSAPVQLNGVPPNTGWEFSYVEPCCRPLTENISQSGAFQLRAIMYSLTPNTNANACYDSSPQFTASPGYAVCRGREFALNNTVIDEGGDSLVFSLGNPNNVVSGSTTPVVYKNGYSFNNPTPDQSFNSNNIPLTIDNQTGNIRGKVSSGSGFMEYWVSYRVDAYRNGKILSTNFREHVLTVFDCQPLNTNFMNSRPEILVNNQVVNNDTILQYFVGDTVRLPIQISDNDTISNGIYQKVTLQVQGEYLSESNNLNDSTNCKGASNRPCAIFQNQGFTFNPASNKPEFSANGSLSTELIWYLDCDLLKSGFRPRRVNFYLKAQDDHCPIPMINYQTITIEVLPNSPQPCVLSTSLIEEKKTEDEISIYPNPTAGNFTIAFESPKKRMLRVRNIQGKLLEQFQTTQAKFDYDLNQAAGIYFIEVIGENGKKYHHKVIKQ